MRDDQFIAIHNSLHSWDGIAQKSIRLGTDLYPLLTTSRAKLRCVVIGGIKFVEQNEATSSAHALEAQQGAQITWAIPLYRKGTKWGNIVNGEVVEPVPEA